MDEAAIRALVESVLGEKLEAALTPAVQGVLEALQGHVDGQLTQLEGKLLATSTEAGKKGADPDKTTSSTGNETLTVRMARLEKQLADSEKARQEAENRRLEAERATKFDREFEAALNNYSPKHREQVVKFLRQELANVKENEGKFYTPDGKLVSEYVDEFFASDFGKDLLPYNGTVGGLGKTTDTPKAGNVPSGNSESAIVGAFL